VRAGVDPTDLAAILLTHHHYDHIGNLGDLVLTAWHGGAAHLPVIGPPGTDVIVEALLGQVYRREIHFTQVLARATGRAEREITDVVKVLPIVGAQSLQHGPWTVTAAAVDHGSGLGLTWDEWPCLAYRLQAGGKTIVVSGDTIPCDNLIALARGADVLVQCCYLADADVTTAARRQVAQHVITTSGQAGKIAAQAGVAHLVLTHFAPMSTAMLAALEADVRRDFAGPVTMGTDLLTLVV